MRVPAKTPAPGRPAPDPSSPRTLVAAPRPHRRSPVARVAAVVALLLAGLGLPATAAADWTPAPQPLATTASPAQTVSTARLAYAPDGTAWSAWGTQAFDASTFTFTYAVQVASRPRGGDWSTPTQLATGASVPRIAVDAAGRPSVSWLAQTTSTPSGVRVSSRDADGTWSAPADVAAGTPSSVTGTFGDNAAVLSRGAPLVAEPDGGLTVVWTQGASLLAASRGAAGAWEAPTVVSTVDAATFPNAGQLNRGVEIGIDAAGRIVGVLNDGGYASTHHGIRAFSRPARAAGQPAPAWSTQAVLVPSDTAASATGRVRNAQVAVAPSGAATVTWGIDSNGQRPEAIGFYAATRSEHATSFGAPQRLSTRGPSESTAATVTYAPDGLATVAWIEPAAGDAPAAVRTRRVQHRKGASDRLLPAGGADTAFSAPAGDALTGPPAVAVDVDGTTTVAWTRSGTVEARRQARGGGWDAPVRPLSTPGRTARVLGWGVGPAGDVDVLTSLQPDVAATPPLATGLESATFRDPATPRAIWSANGLTGSLNLRTFIDYLGGNDGVLPSDGAERPSDLDPYSYRLTFDRAFRSARTGETVVALRGTMRFRYPAHFIDTTIVDPELRIAADGRSGRVIADGQGSGELDMGATEPDVEPFAGVTLLDLDLSRSPALLSGDGALRTWSDVRATVAADPAPRYLTYGTGSAFGLWTITAPAALTVEPDGAAPQGDPPPSDPGPGGPTTQPPGTAPPGGPGTPMPPAKPGSPAPRTTGTVGRRRAGGRTATVAVSRRIGRSATVRYAVRLVRKGRVVATGTLRNRTLRLQVRRSARKGARTTYPRLKGTYQLRAAPGQRASRRIATTTIVLR